MGGSSAVDRDAEERLMTDDAKISDKSPLSQEVGGGQHQKAAARSACALKASDAFLWPAFKPQLGI